MKKYSYQLIRYQPDVVSGEFLNVGITLLDSDQTFLKAKTIDKIGRVKHLFPKVNSRAFVYKLKNIANNINSISDKWNQGLNIKEETSIQKITGSILPKDDSSLYFSDVINGIDLTPQIAFQDLFQRFILNNETVNDSYLTDKDVWNSYYKSYFKDHKDKLQPKSVLTDGDCLKFEYAIKNGVWNYLEPVTFDLSRELNVKEKVYKWMGKLDELDSSQEHFKLYLLTKMPSDPTLKKFIKDRIEINSSDNFEVKVIEPEHAESFSRKLIESVDHS